MKRVLFTSAAVLAVAALIGLGVARARPDLVPAWARVGKAHSARDGHDHGNAPGGEGGAGHDHVEKGHGEGDEEEHGHGEGGHANEAKLSAEAIKRYGIQVGPVTKHVLVPTFTAPARVSYNTEAMAHVGSSVTGRVAELKAKVGDHVKKGDVLLVLQSPELGEAQNEYLQRLTATRTAAPAIDIARSGFERARDLYQQTRGIAVNEVQKREAEFKSAQAALQAAQGAATAAESKLRQLGMDSKALEALARTVLIDPHYTIFAPIAGQVVEREVTLGELVDPQQESLLVLADLSTLWVLADVPESRSQDVAVEAKARVVTAGGKHRGFEGLVSFISPALDPATRTVPVRIVVRNERTTLRPGMFAQVEITVTGPDAPTEPVLAVPEPAIQTVEGKPAVFVPVEGEENTFAARPITTGRAVGALVPVLSGLKEGEPIVTAGSFILKAELGKGSAAHEH